MDDNEKKKVLRQFHTVDLYVSSAISYLCGLAITALLATAIVVNDRNCLWACIPVVCLWIVSGRYEKSLRKQLNDPLMDYETFGEAMDRIKKENDM